jgi:SWI/SNF-related matrix-associated actin-dependent regulator 1 of chromatin subfamily A
MDYKKKVQLEKDILKITFVYSPITVNQVKTLSGRKWHPASKYWSCPPSFENFEKLIEWGFNLNDRAQKAWDKLNEAKNVQLDVIPGFEKMYPFQLKGVEFIESKNGRALVGDEMGLGKTIQALGYLALHPELRPAVIVCPASLKLNWEKECYEWLGFGERVYIAQGTKIPDSWDSFRMENNGDENIIIINYDILDSWIDFLSLMQPKVLILDEAHYIKNTKAKRSKAVKKLAKKCQHVIGLTGTPIINRPIEFFAILNLLNPTEWNNRWSYAHKYCGAKHNGFGWDFNGSSNPDELNQALKRTMIRRLKSEVLPELPAKIRTVIPLEITNRKEYNNMVNELDESDSPAIQLTRIEKLKQLVVEGKIKACINWITDFLESGEKLVVFATHKIVIHELFNSLGYYFPVKIDGSVSQLARQQAVEDFQNNPNCKLFIGNIKAAGVGLTLTAASSTCFLELGWTPGDHDQAEDRVHRIGQESDSVNTYYLLGKDTIDMEIAELLDQKRKVLDSVLDGTVTEETNLLTELMKRLTGDNK